MIKVWSYRGTRQCEQRRFPRWGHTAGTRLGGPDGLDSTVRLEHTR